MEIKLVFLWTDLLIYLLLLSAIGFAAYSIRFEHLRSPWRQVAHNRLAMVAGFVLFCYIIIGLCDSIHFQERAADEKGQIVKDSQGEIIYKPDVLSVLDILVTSIRENTEDSYSAPLATNSYSMKNITLPDGKQIRTYAKLKYGGKHLFGTDKVGMDVFYRALKGIRTGIVIGTLTTLIMLPFAIMMGIMAGYFKGWVDDLIQYIYTTLSSIPGVLLIASAILMLQVYMDTHADRFENIIIRADTRLFFLCVILGVSSWTGLCRILRGETLKLMEMEYVQASMALGVGHFKILLKHIIPNIMHIVLISVVLDFSGLVLAEAVLSYVGVGVDPTMESWGNMINAARLELAREPIVWWNLAAAFILMFGLVLSANLFADAVRDAFDPRLRTK
ncbi:MAG: ABC transporter permease [Nitrospinota bacterium]